MCPLMGLWNMLQIFQTLQRPGRGLPQDYIPGTPASAWVCFYAPFLILEKSPFIMFKHVLKSVLKRDCSPFRPRILLLLGVCVFVEECQVDSKQLSHAVVMFLTRCRKIWLDNYNRLPWYAPCVRHFTLKPDIRLGRSLFIEWEVCVCACVRSAVRGC